MTDEKVKEEFERFLRIDLKDDEASFAEGFNQAFEPAALGFYAGFRTAERLAKIEVLEELMDKITTQKMYWLISGMIDELKAGN